MKKIVGFLSLAIIAGLLSGCAGIAGPSTPTKFYRVTAATLQKTAPQPALANIQLGLGPISIPGYTDRPQIVTAGSGGLLIVDDLNHWAEPVQDNIERIMVANVASLLSDEQVFRYPASFTPAPSSLQISVEIREMIRKVDGKVQLTANWNIKRLLDNRLLKREAIQYVSSNKAADYAQYSQILSTLFGQLAKDIVKSVGNVNSTS